MMGKKRKRGTANKKQPPYFLKRKKEEAGNVSEERVKGWIHQTCLPIKSPFRKPGPKNMISQEI